MAAGKSPAFQFYPDAWLSSQAVLLMTPAEEGAYIRLLCHAWAQEDCGLPDDDDTLATLSRLGRQWHEGSGRRVRAKFRSDGGKLYNDRLLEERHKQEEWRRKSSAGGKKSAASRARQRQNLSPPKTPSKGGSRVVEKWLEPNANSSSSSSLLLRSKESGGVPPLAGGNGRPTGEAADSPAGSAKPYRPYWQDKHGNLKPEFKGCGEFTEEEIAEVEQQLLGGDR